MGMARVQDGQDLVNKWIKWRRKTNKDHGFLEGNIVAGGILHWESARNKF